MPGQPFAERYRSSKQAGYGNSDSAIKEIGKGMAMAGGLVRVSVWGSEWRNWTRCGLSLDLIQWQQSGRYRSLILRRMVYR